MYAIKLIICHLWRLLLRTGEDRSPQGSICLSIYLSNDLSIYLSISLSRASASASDRGGPLATHRRLQTPAIAPLGNPSYAYMPIYVYIHMYVYTHVYISLSLYLSLSLYIYTYIYRYICIYLSIHVYIHTYISMYIMVCPLCTPTYRCIASVVETGWSPWGGHPYDSMAIVRLLPDIKHLTIT